MANIEMVLNKFIKEDQPDHPLIIDENKIPNTAFLHNAIQSDNRSYFFGKENNRVDYDLISSVYLMDYQFKNQTENFGKKNPYAAVFSPQRLLVRSGAKRFLVDMWESVIGIGSGVFAKKNQKCTHMGCTLQWNAEEESWDCPCHGSRYTKEGEVMDNPAQEDKGW